MMVLHLLQLLLCRAGDGGTTRLRLLGLNLVRQMSHTAEYTPINAPHPPHNIKNTLPGKTDIS